MLRLIVFALIGATAIGAMMPSGKESYQAPESTATIIPGGASRGDSDSSSSAGFGETRIERSSDGHFYADAEVNGARVHFLVDTGASGIALTRDDARRAGVAQNGGTGEVVGIGAGGELTGERVSLERVSLGAVSASGMDAIIVDGGEMSLLGQRFLAKFASVEIRGDTMVLR